MRLKLVYIHSETEKEVVADFLSDRFITIQEALYITGVDMDEYASSKGWESYDYNALDLEY